MPPAPKPRNVRLVRRGDIIRYTTTDDTVVEDVVREVRIVILLATGESPSFPVNSKVEVLPKEDLVEVITDAQNIDDLEGDPEPEPGSVEPAIVAATQDHGHTH